MSSVYISEPPTTGHVILYTNTYGTIDIHLYCNECPTITKYFLQLCYHNYYNDIIFHRILSNLLIQTGLVRYNTTTTGNNRSATATNTSSESSLQQQQQQMKQYHQHIHAYEVYERRQYELHSRIRFSHRGQIAMALPIIKNDDDVWKENIDEMLPQFFITTDEAPYLNDKHVIFGTVIGPTIFNVIRINQYNSGSGDDDDDTNNIDTYDSSTPRIISTKIITNPFEDSMIPLSSLTIPWLTTTGSTNHMKKKKKRKGKFDINVLSFGDDVVDNDIVAVSSSIKKKPYHHQDDENDGNDNNVAPSTIGSLKTTTDRQDEKQEAVLDVVKVSLVEPPVHNDVSLLSPPPPPPPPPPQQQQQQQSESKDDDIIGPVSTSKSKISAVEAHRAKYLSKKNQRQDLNAAINNGVTSSKQQRDDETYNKLLHFRRKIHDVIIVQSKNDNTAAIMSQQDNSLAARMARRAQQEEEDKNRKSKYNDNVLHPSYHGQILYDNNDDDDDDDEVDPNQWMHTKFICKKHMDHLSGDNKDAMVEYEVIDPKNNQESSSSSNRKSRGETKETKAHRRRR